MLVNGHPQDFLPLSDRAIHYGDGAFETVLVREGRLIYWQRHLSRLARACSLLQIPLETALLEQEARSLVTASDDTFILKMIVTRGSGGRGYTPPEVASPRRIVMRYPLPPDYSLLAERGIGVLRCHHPISENPASAGLKHLNRLDQVIASLELPADCHEGLMCNAQGDVVEGIKSNVFLVQAGRLATPLLDRAGVSGIQREVVLEICAAQKLSCQVREVSFAEVLEADEVFVCNSVFGIWPVIHVRSSAACRTLTPGPMTRTLQSLLGSTH